MECRWRGPSSLTPARSTRGTVQQPSAMPFHARRSRRRAAGRFGCSRNVGQRADVYGRALCRTERCEPVVDRQQRIAQHDPRLEQRGEQRQQPRVHRRGRHVEHREEALDARRTLENARLNTQCQCTRATAGRPPLDRLPGFHEFGNRSRSSVCAGRRDGVVGYSTDGILGHPCEAVAAMQDARPALRTRARLC